MGTQHATTTSDPEGRGKWMALTAALLGWMFDGLEQGLFPLVGRPALKELLNATDEKQVAVWFSVATAGFLVGAATGGVLFGWLGDRIGRVRAMTLSVMTYALFSGLCGFSTTATQVAVLRFFSSVGMGGEWSLGVALVMEIWPDRSRSLMAGFIGAAANVGYMLLALVGMAVSGSIDRIHSGLLSLGLPNAWVDTLTQNSAWRLLMFLGALPALLTFFIRLFVPESERWTKEQDRGTTSNWAGRDLLGVGIGVGGAFAIIYLWVASLDLALQIGGTIVALGIMTVGYCYPIVRYLQRSEGNASSNRDVWVPTVRRMLLGACLSGVPLVVTWSSVQWSSVWTDQLTHGAKQAKEYTQFCAAVGAIIGCIGGGLLGGWLGRRITYALLCACSLAAALVFFLTNDQFGPYFLFTVFLVGLFSASFYGWLPLYLPELFTTRVRATGQGFSYNFGRNLAVVGALSTGNLTAALNGKYHYACAIMAGMYLVGLMLIWFAPETRGQPLPE